MATGIGRRSRNLTKGIMLSPPSHTTASTPMCRRNLPPSAHTRSGQPCSLSWCSFRLLRWAPSDAAALVCGSPPELPEINQSVTRREGAPEKPVEIVVVTRASSSPCTPKGELSRPIRLRSAEVDGVGPNQNPGSEFGSLARTRSAGPRPPQSWQFRQLQRLERLPETGVWTKGCWTCSD